MGERRHATEGREADDLAGLTPGAPPTASQKKKREYDKGRVRLWLDVTEDIKAATEQAAKSQDTSMTQFVASVYAYGLALFLRDDPQLLAAMDDARVAVRSVNFGHGYDLSVLSEQVADFAERRWSASTQSH